jgi:hypothetical protein
MNTNQKMRFAASLPLFFGASRGLCGSNYSAGDVYGNLRRRRGFHRSPVGFLVE